MMLEYICGPKFPSDNNIELLSKDVANTILTPKSNTNTVAP